MAFLHFEEAEYQDFLVAEARLSLVPAEIYERLIPYDPNAYYSVLDFGCGLGYASMLLAQKFKEHEKFKIYACDYQEELLDRLWKRIVNRNPSSSVL